MKKYCINLPERYDRYCQADQEFFTAGLNVKFVNAIKSTPGYVGCAMSYLQCLNNGNKTFAIFEDDVLFTNGWKWFLLKAMLQLPKNWDALYLGATLNEPLCRYSDNLFRLRKGWTTHAIIWNNQNGVVDYILNNADRVRKIDVFLTEVQDLFNVFITYPMCATQRPGHSDIVNKFTDYNQIQKRYEKYTTAVV